ncbi:MAG: hypothetical protein K4304_12320 [Propionicimonas sp.]
MLTALDQLKIDVARDDILKDRILSATTAGRPAELTTNVNTIHIDPEQGTVTIHDDVLITDEPVTKLSLVAFVEELNALQPADLTVTDSRGRRKTIKHPRNRR